MSTPYQTDAVMLGNSTIQGDYHQLDLNAPEIAAAARPGQFVHVQLPGLEHRILRRPFSIYDTDPKTGRLSIIYKVVGEGTAHLATIDKVGTVFNVLGPLGHGYTVPSAKQPLVIVAGGYGCAATYLLAKHSPAKTLVLIGGRTAGDILLKDNYEALGCTVRIATNDGSMGTKGFVTELLKEAIGNGAKPWVEACGPNPMLKAVADLTLPAGITTEISLDHAMCCGVGACFACVVKVIDSSNADGWRYSRSCLEGPVYNAQDVYWN